MKHIIKKLSFFATSLKEAYQEQRIAYHLEHNTKKIAAYQEWEKRQKTIDPHHHADKAMNYEPLLLGYADKPVLYQAEAAAALEKFLKNPVRPEEMVLSSLESRFLHANLNSIFFTTVWLYQNSYFVELGVSIGKKRSKVGFLDKRMFDIEALGSGCAPHAVIITYYGIRLNAMPHCSLYYVVENNDLKPLTLVRYGNGTGQNTEVIETYKTRVSYAEILAATKKDI